MFVCTNLVLTFLTMPEAKLDRRSRRRVSMRVPVKIRRPDGVPEITGQTRDLSSSGIFLYIDEKISAGTLLEMVLILPPEVTQGEKRWVCCQASVVRVEDAAEGGKFGLAANLRSIEVLPEIPT
jgi:hypothetical protein